ncbi:hypothetical protein FB451DRAFT_1199459, partial [Mycena latifolia]
MSFLMPRPPLPLDRFENPHCQRLMRALRTKPPFECETARANGAVGDFIRWGANCSFCATRTFNYSCLYSSLHYWKLVNGSDSSLLSFHHPSVFAELFYLNGLVELEPIVFYKASSTSGFPKGWVREERRHLNSISDLSYLYTLREHYVSLRRRRQGPRTFVISLAQRPRGASVPVRGTYSPYVAPASIFSFIRDTTWRAVGRLYSSAMPSLPNLILPNEIQGLLRFPPDTPLHTLFTPATLQLFRKINQAAVDQYPGGVSIHHLSASQDGSPASLDLQGWRLLTMFM